MAKKKVATPVKNEYPKVVETFRRISEWSLSGMRQDGPSCFNGIVQVRRYRITVEEIYEPNEVIVARLQKLWDESDNHHHYRALQTVAAQYGVNLSDGFGKDRKK